MNLLLHLPNSTFFYGAKEVKIQAYIYVGRYSHSLHVPTSSSKKWRGNLVDLHHRLRYACLLWHQGDGGINLLQYLLNSTFSTGIHLLNNAKEVEV